LYSLTAALATSSRLLCARGGGCARRRRLLRDHGRAGKRDRSGKERNAKLHVNSLKGSSAVYRRFV
jgi:hypothetical protein